MKDKFTLTQFKVRFPDDAACLEELKRRVFGDELACPKCTKTNKFYRVTGRSAYACSFCGHHIYPLKNTPFDHSSTSLWTWYYAIFLMAQTRSGISAKTLERMTGVTYKTAWRMFHQIRKLMAEDGVPLVGDVEVDEAYFHPNPQRRSTAQAHNSQVVLGAVERGGRAKAWHVKSSGSRVIIPMVVSNVAAPSNIFTDDYRAYNILPVFNYGHASIKHSEGKYVNGKTHTQNVENLWSHAKLGIRGVYRHVSPKYLQTYLDEYTFRYSNRKYPKQMFDLILSQVAK